jgi:hypothetical protein
MSEVFVVSARAGDVSNIFTAKVAEKSLYKN